MDSGALQIAKFEANVGRTRLGVARDDLGQLLGRAKVHPMPPDEATAHAFSRWVFRLGHGTREHIDHKKPSFLDQAGRTIADVMDRLVDGQVGAWRLVSRDDGTATGVVYRASALTLRGEPLRLRPDAVFAHERIGVIVIFEYKIPRPGISVPAHGWPNLAAQLWAYSWVDQWADNANVILVGGIFDWDGRQASLGATLPRTTKSDRALNEACQRLFRAWGGRIQPTLISSLALRRILSV